MGKILHLRVGLDGEVRSAQILLPNRMVITRAVNFLCPLELPTLQEENIHDQEWDGKNKQGQRTYEDTADLNGVDESVVKQRSTESNFNDDKMRRAALIAQKRIFDCLRDNGTSVLFCLSPGRLSRRYTSWTC